MPTQLTYIGPGDVFIHQGTGYVFNKGEALVVPDDVAADLTRKTPAVFMDEFGSLVTAQPNEHAHEFEAAPAPRRATLSQPGIQPLVEASNASASSLDDDTQPENEPEDAGRSGATDSQEAGE